MTATDEAATMRAVADRAAARTLAGGPLAGHFCGQTQPHDAHVWQTPQVYGSTAIISTYQCAGLLP